MSLVLYIVVNKELRMGAGKAASQCCHAVAGVIRQLERGRGRDTLYRQWLRQGEAKVVLKASEADMRRLLAEVRQEQDVVCCPIEDEGRTQVASGSFTAIAFSPLPKEQAHPLLQSLPLL